VTTLALFPLRAVLLPGSVLSLHIFEFRYREMLRRCRRNGETFGIVLIREGSEVGGAARPFDVGTEAALVAVEDLPDGRTILLVEGRRRFRIRRVVTGNVFPEGDVEWLPEDPGDAEDWRRTVLDLLADSNLHGLATRCQECVELSYRLADALARDAMERQEFLEAPDAGERLHRAAVLLLRTQTRMWGAG